MLVALITTLFYFYDWFIFSRFVLMIGFVNNCFMDAIDWFQYLIDILALAWSYRIDQRVNTLYYCHIIKVVGSRLVSAMYIIWWYVLYLLVNVLFVVAILFAIDKASATLFLVSLSLCIALCTLVLIFFTFSEYYLLDHDNYLLFLNCSYFMLFVQSY